MRWQFTYDGFQRGRHSSDCECLYCRRGVVIPTYQSLAKEEEFLTVWNDVFEELAEEEWFGHLMRYG